MNSVMDSVTDDAILLKLKTLLSQPDREALLDEPRRLAELVRERLGSARRREAAFLNTVLQEGVPKRLLALPASSLSATMLDNYAKTVAEDTGLKEEVARAAIAAWAAGLGLVPTADGKAPPARAPAGARAVAAGGGAAPGPATSSGSKRPVIIGVGIAALVAAALIYWLGWSTFLIDLAVLVLIIIIFSLFGTEGNSGTVIRTVLIGSYLAVRFLFPVGPAIWNAVTGQHVSLCDVPGAHFYYNYQADCVHPLPKLQIPPWVRKPIPKL